MGGDARSRMAMRSDKAFAAAPTARTVDPTHAEWESFLLDDARKSLRIAIEHARALHHDHVGSLHLLLGLRLATQSIAAYALKAAGVEPEPLLSELRNIPNAGMSQAAGLEPVMTPYIRRVLERASMEARVDDQGQIGSDRLLQTLLQEHDGASVGAAVQFLSARGLSIDRILQELGRGIHERQSSSSVIERDAGIMRPRDPTKEPIEE